MNIVEAPGALEKENVVGRGPGPFDLQILLMALNIKTLYQKHTVRILICSAGCYGMRKVS